METPADSSGAAAAATNAAEGFNSSVITLPIGPLPLKQAKVAVDFGE